MNSLSELSTDTLLYMVRLYDEKIAPHTSAPNSVVEAIQAEISARAVLTEAIYTNLITGSTGTYDDWYYRDENSREVNAVELGEVVVICASCSTYSGDAEDFGYVGGSAYCLDSDHDCFSQALDEARENVPAPTPII